MWLFTQNGFFSIVAHRDEPEILIVRARVRGDIERYWPREKVFMTPGFDYLYRAFIPKEVVAGTIGKIVLDVDYGSYKGSLADKRRGPWYVSVWSAMCHMQQALKYAN